MLVATIASDTIQGHLQNKLFLWEQISDRIPSVLALP